MSKQFVASVEVEFTSDQEDYLQKSREWYDQSYGLFQSIGAKVESPEITSDGGSVMAKTGLWVETFHYTLCLELQSVSLTKLNHQIAIVHHWAELVGGDSSVLLILPINDTLS